MMKQSPPTREAFKRRISENNFDQQKQKHGEQVHGEHKQVEQKQREQKHGEHKQGEVVQVRKVIALDGQNCRLFEMFLEKI